MQWVVACNIHGYPEGSPSETVVYRIRLQNVFNKTAFLQFTAFFNNILKIYIKLTIQHLQISIHTEVN